MTIQTFFRRNLMNGKGTVAREESCYVRSFRAMREE